MLSRILPIMLAALLALTLAGVASAHSNLVSSTPAAGATLATAPTKITLVFSEELSADGNLVTVTDAKGTQVDQGDTTLDLNDPNRVTVTVSLKAGLGDGAYTVSWKNLSVDGHSEEGTFNFSVGAAAAPSAPATLPATGAGDDLPIAVFLALAAALLGLGLGIRRRPVH
jgi:LPXTG-motif cell wall-anchored protein